MTKHSRITRHARKPLQDRQSAKKHTNERQHGGREGRRQFPKRVIVFSEDWENVTHENRTECLKNTQLFIDEKRKFTTVTAMKTQQTGWKLKRSSSKRAKDRERENRRKSEGWSRKYNTHMIGVLERKTCHRKRIRQLERTRWLLSTIDENRLPHRKVIVKFRTLGKGKDSTQSQGKGKKGQVQSIKNQDGFPLPAATLGGSMHQRMPSHFWRWFSFDLEFFVQDRHAFRWEDKDLSGDFPGG